MQDVGDVPGPRPWNGAVTDSGGDEVLGVWAVLFSVFLMVVNMLLSVQLSLGLHKTMAVATFRCAVQLTLLGYILAPAFGFDRWWLVLIYSAVLLVIAAVETVSRPPAAYEGMLTHVLLSMGGSSALVLLYAILLVLRPRPWFHAQLLLPTLAMLLTNAIGSISQGLASVLEELTAGRERVEMLLAIGASRTEATQAVVQRALVAALSPMLNQMSVIGLVSIPTFMNGQLIGGGPAPQAARYQLVLLLLMVTTATLGSTAAVYAAIFSVLDGKHRLRSERLISRQGRESGVAQWVTAQAVKGWKALRLRARRIVARLRVVAGQRTRAGERGRQRSKGSWWRNTFLGRRIFGNRQGQDQMHREDYDEVGSINSRLRDVIVGNSDDELESTFSGPLSENEELMSPQPAREPFGVSPSDDSRRNLLASPQRPD